MKTGKKLISFLLCAALLLTVAPLQALPAFANEYGDAYPLSLESEIYVDIEEFGETVVEFTPEADVNAQFTIDSLFFQDYVLYDYTEEYYGSALASVWYYEDNYILWHFEADHTYRFLIHSEVSESNVCVSLTPYDGILTYEQLYDGPKAFSTAVGGSVELTADAWSNRGELTYQWYDPDGEPIDGCTERTAALEGINKSGTYVCSVSDGDGNTATVQVTVTVESGLNAWRALDSEVYISPTADLWLAVDACIDPGAGDVYYRWYYNGEEIAGATEWEYTETAPVRTGVFACTVYDDFGNEITLDFEVRIEKQFTINNSYVIMFVSPGDDAVLRVDADCNEGAALHYDWYVDICFDEYSEEQYLSAPDAASYTETDFSENTRYYCHVSDEYGNQDTVTFYVYCDTPTVLSTNTEYTAVIESWNDGAWFAFTPENSGWYRFASADVQEYVNVTLLNDAFERLDRSSGWYIDFSCYLQAGETYYYMVSYSDMLKTGSFPVWISLDNGLSAWADSDDHFQVNTDETVSMAVNYSVNEGEVAFQWYLSSATAFEAPEDEVLTPIEGAVEAAYTSLPMQQTSVFVCRVTDQFGNSKDVRFFVACKRITPILPGQQAEAVTEYYDDVALFSFIPEESGEYVFWSEADVDTYGFLYDADMNELSSDDDSGENSNFRLVAQLTAGETYYFGARLYNRNPGSFPVFLVMYFENNLQVEILGDSEFYVAPDTDVTLQVEVTANDLSLASRVWRDPDDNVIEGEEGDTLSLTGVFPVGYYHFSISDGYGNSETKTFWVQVDNEFSAYPKNNVSDIYVIAGETETLEVETSFLKGPVVYQWYSYERVYVEEWDDYDWKTAVIPGATDAVYETPAVNEKVKFFCRVRDPYGHETDVWFSLNPVVAVPIALNTETPVEAGEDEIEAFFFFVPETTGTYRFCSTGEADTSGCLYDAELNPLRSDDDSGEDNNFLIEAELEAGKTYYFAARAYYAESFSVWLKLHDPNGFSADAVDDTYVSVKGGQPVTLRVEVQAAKGSVFCRWTDNDGTVETGEVELAETGPDGLRSGEAVLTATPAYSYNMYTCEVWDEYENTASVTFDVNVDNSFYAYARDGRNTVRTVKWQPATLAVEAECTWGEISYQWQVETALYDEEYGFSYPGYVDIEDADGAEFVTPAVTETNYYRCRVKDPYQTRYVDFTVIPVTVSFIEQNVQTAAELTDENERAVYYSFTPEETGVYGFRSLDAAFPVYGAVFDADFTEQSYTYESVGNDFVLSYELTADETYYFSVGSWDSAGTVTVLLKPHDLNGFYAYAAGDDDVVVKGGTPAVLEVDAHADKGELHYQWYDDAGFVIEGQTDDTFTFDPLSYYESYTCKVWDDYENHASVTFWVSVDNNFVVYAKDEEYNVYVACGDPARLEVIATAFKDEPMTFRWFGPDGNEIEDAADSWYVTPAVTSAGQYACEVTDPYGDSRTVWFSVGVENNLTVTIVGDNEIVVYPLTTPTLAVTVTATDDAGLVIEWFINWYDSVEGADGTSYTMPPVTGKSRYTCRVTDRFGNVREAEFYVGVKNDFTATAVGDEQRTAAPGERLTLAVEASARVGDVHYQWFDADWDDIPGETGPTYQTPPVNRLTFYGCRVYDDYGSSSYIPFNISVENGFSATWAEGNGTVRVAPGADVDLKVLWHTNDGVMTFQWYDENWYKIPGETGDTLSLTNVTSNGTYHCRAEDSYGSYTHVSFNVSIENNFSAQRVGNYWVYVTPGDDVTLQVRTTADNGPLRFVWTDYHDVIIGSTDTLVLTDVTNSGYYECYVADPYGNCEYIGFYVSLDNGLSAEPIPGENVTVTPGETQALSVQASCKKGSLTYQWYALDLSRVDGFGYTGTERILSGETSDSFVTPPINTFTVYKCIVRDEYGTSEEVRFHLRADSGLTVRTRDSELAVPLNTSADLAVDAVSDGEMYVQWYLYGEDPETGDWGWQPCENGNGLTFTTSAVTGRVEYACTVWDDYENYYTVHFSITVDTGLTVQPLEGKDAFSVAPGADLTIGVAAAAYEGVELSYQWYDDVWTEIPGQTGDTLELFNVRAATHLVCEVRDNYGNSINIRFSVSIDNKFSAYAEKTDFLLIGGGDADLHVDASCADGDIIYRWYDSAFNLLSETGNTLCLTDVTESCRYTCEVSDCYGNREFFAFNLVCELPVPLTLRTWTDAVIGTDYARVLFSFTPETDGTYVIYSDADEDTYVHLYDADLKQLATNDDGGERSNFRLSYPLTAGQTYYYAVRFYDVGTGTIPVYLLQQADNGFRAYADKGEVSAAYGETAELKVIAAADDGDLHFRWYDDNGRLVEGAVSETLTVGPVTAFMNYTCYVSDDYGNSSELWFRVIVENGFTATWADGSGNVLIAPGDSVTLGVTASAANGEIRYQWVRGAYGNPIPGATGSTLEVGPLEGRETYRCDVTDVYGTVITLWFYVSVDNGLTLRAKDGETTVYADYGTAALLETEVTFIKGDVYYQWYRYEDITADDGHTYYSRVLIEGETGSSLRTGPVTGETEYMCTVTDDYGGERSVYITVCVNSGLTVQNAEDYNFIPVAPGTSATLTVEASANVEITYTWTLFSYGEYGYSETVLEETGNTLVTPPVTGRMYYTCCVTDIYGQSVYVYFIVYVDTGIPPRAYYDNIVYTVPGGSAVLNVPLTPAGDFTFCYEWYSAGDTLAETGSTLTVTGLTENSYYYCAVEDGYGNYAEYYFTVIVTDEPVYIWGPEYESVTATLVLDEENTVTETVVPTAAETPADCENAGSIVFTAEFQNEYFTAQTRTVTVSPLGHQWSDWTVETAPACTEDGAETRVCARCGKEESRVLAQFGHAWGEPTYEWAEDYGTVTATRVCANDANHVETETVQATGEQVPGETPPGEEKYVYTSAAFENPAFTVQTRTVFVNHTHTPGEPVTENVTDASCTENGSYDEVVYCSVCGEELSRTAGIVIPALGHDPVHHDAKAPTCTEIGWAAYDTCTRCDYTTYVEQAVLGHDMGEWTEVTAPTCTADGEETRACSRCDFTETRVATALGHDYALVVTPPTCTEAGYTTHTCSRCGYTFTDTPVTALGHDMGEWTATTPPTCTEEGEETRVCSRCDFTETRVAAALGHDYALVVTPPTCTEAGYTTHTCTRCGLSFTDTPVTALGHDMGEWTVTTPPTCTAEGEETSACSRCDYKDTRVAAALGHDYALIVTPPTCTEAGYTTHTCTRCGLSFTDTPVTALGHDMGEWTLTTPPTCTVNGEETSACSRCDYKDTRAVSSLGHDYRETVVPPTCTQAGYTEHTCSRCGESFTDTPVTALGHDFGDWTQTKAPSCTEKGEKRRNCSRCDAYETEEIAALGHDFSEWTESKAPTCTEKGEESRSCSRCTEKETREIAVLGHNFGDWTQTKAPSCTEKGEKRRNCSRCDAYETEEIAALGHDLVNHEAKAPTCTEIGWDAYDTCTRCDYTTYAEKAALGHDLVNHEAKAPTCTEIGWDAYDTCTRCDYTTYAEKAALGHNWGEWTKLNDAVHQRVCKHDPSHTETVPHTWNAGEVTKPATVTEAGIKTYTCTACGAQKTEEIGKLPDTPVTVTDPGSGVSVTYNSTAYGQKITVKVVAVDTPESGLPAVYEKTYSVDISTYIGDKEVEPKAPVTVTIPVPQGFNAATLKLFHVKDDGSVEEIPCTVKDGKITFTALAFSVYVVADISTEVKEPAFKAGDVDGDGDVDTSDARLALRRSIGLEKYPEGSREFKACDVNRDAKVGTDDARYILRHAIGLTDAGIVW